PREPDPPPPSRASIRPPHRAPAKNPVNYRTASPYPTGVGALWKSPIALRIPHITSVPKSHRIPHATLSKTRGYSPHLVPPAPASGAQSAVRKLKAFY